MERPSLDSGLSHGFTLTFITLCPPLSRLWDCGQGQCSIHPLPLNQCSAHRTSSVNMTGWVVEWRVQNPLSSVPMHQHNTDQSLRSLPRYRGPLIFSVYCRLWSYYWQSELRLKYLAWRKSETHTGFLLAIIKNICMLLFFLGKFQNFVLIWLMGPSPQWVW